MATCSLESLIDEACENKFTCLDERVARAVILQLLCDISSSGGLGSVQILSSLDANPNSAAILPADTSQGAIFYQDPSITLYNEWKWSVTGQAWYQTISP